MDFDDLDDAEEEREQEEAPLRAAAEDEEVRKEQALHFVALVAAPRGEASSSGLVELHASPDFDSYVVGERRVGDVLCLARKRGAWAMLHPLELARVAQDYQDYWHAILKCEVPRKRDEAWIPLNCLKMVEAGKVPDSYPSQASTAKRVDSIEERLLGLRPRSSPSREALELVGQAVTVIISTSPAEHHCKAEWMLWILRSIQENPALAPCRKIVVFDALPSDAPHQGTDSGGAVAESGKRWVPQGNPKLAESYERYKEALKAASAARDSAMDGVELLFMPTWGHLVGTVRYAVERVNTPYVMLHQHDLLLTKNFTPGHAVGILRSLARREANYVILNRDVNFTSRTTNYFHAAFRCPEEWRSFVRRHGLALDDAAETPLLPFVGFSDQTHFARTSWVRDRVLPMVGERKCCMEFAVYEIMLLGWLHDPSRWERTYLLGAMHDGPFIYDLQKNGNCWATEAEAYGPEKEEEIFVSPEARMRHPVNRHLFLSLYIFEEETPYRKGGIGYYPDAHSFPNKVCMDRFAVDGREMGPDWPGPFPSMGAPPPPQFSGAVPKFF